MNYVLSIDLSTTVAGYCISKDKELIKLDYYKFNKDFSLIQKIKELYNFLQKILQEYNISNFVIEERLKSFRAGGTNANAMLSLAIFNTISQYFISEFNPNIVIHTINVQTARKLAFPGFHKIARLKKAENKKLAFEFVIKDLGESYFPKKIMKSGVRKNQEVFIDEAMDMGDAYVLFKAFINQ